jgi:ribosomal subunit interface protein
MTKTYDFPVSFKCIHEECDDMFKNTAIEEVKKLSRYHTRIIDGSVIVDKKNPSVKVEVSVRVPGMVITGSHTDFNRAVALDAAVEKTKTQVKKLKSKVESHRVSHPTVSPAEETEPSS